jgi:hypothetical protein
MSSPAREVSSSSPQPASSASAKTVSTARRVLWPELKTGSRVTTCTNGGTPRTTASHSPPNSATATRVSVGRTSSAAAPSISGSAPT